MRGKLITATALAAISLAAGAAAVHARGTVGRTTTLPYYADSTLTPEWIARGSDRIARLHRTGDFALIAQDGHTATAGEMDGRIYVAHFFFTTCGDVCPLTTRNLSTLLDSLPGEDRFRIASFSVAGDSAASLAAYARHHHLDTSRWLLLGGPKREIARLARESYFAGTARGSDYGVDSVAHTDLVVLVDGERHIRGVYNATLPLEIQQLLADVRTLLRERGASTQERRAAENASTDQPS
jgi:protein SCO1/2